MQRRSCYFRINKNRLERYYLLTIIKTLGVKDNGIEKKEDFLKV